jgi:hypothetical protein
MYVNKKIKDRTAVSAFEVGKLWITDKNVGCNDQQMKGFGKTAARCYIKACVVLP